MTEKNDSVKHQNEEAVEKEQEQQNNSQNNDASSTEQTDDQSVAENEAVQEEDEQKEDQSETSDDDLEEVDPKDEEIERLKQESKSNEDKYLRLYAEFENYKRRITKENQTMKTYQSQSVLNDILPTIDNIERALQIEGDDEQFKSLQKGVQMVYESLLKALKDNGLEEIKTSGEQFDPNFHQAVMQDENPEFESGEITQELQKGYKLKDRVLRPSMVKVNQ